MVAARVSEARVEAVWEVAAKAVAAMAEATPAEEELVAAVRTEAHHPGGCRRPSTQGIPAGGSTR